MTIKNLKWELEASFTRSQVIAMGTVADFVGNIQSMLEKDFPSSVKDVNWEEFRKAMSIFGCLKEKDKAAYLGLVNVVLKANDGKLKILGNKVYEVEK